MGKKTQIGKTTAWRPRRSVSSGLWRGRARQALAGKAVMQKKTYIPAGFELVTGGGLEFYGSQINN